ncbi:ABC transporter permease [Maledivibacter halophilus]|uniref:Nucleoside ABC transporter membrane protein n=1 Tax=Maledivibacter halophilus TaxID=36842 RepID=A0A1T5MPT4_9FIRM|nr:ABC transporter permease [Maledivibacter halophilus]SKC90235.1 nucleoside ABC transporter membrane protein [Maledivibacter halophilus]
MLRFITNEKNHKFIVPILSVLFGFIAGAIIMIITGIDPLEGYDAMIKGIFGNLRKFGEWIVASIPLILTGLAVAFGFRTGLFNIGVEGQLIVGSFAAVAVGILLNLPKFIHLPLALLAAGIAGGIWGFIPGFLKARFKVHEVVVTIMLNYTALHLVNYLIKLIPGSTNTETVKILPSADLGSDFLSRITGNSRLHWGVIIALLAAIIFWYIIERTAFGYELRSVGFNPDASKYAGMKVERNIIYSMMISGVFAGFAGAMISIGTFDYGRVIGGFEGYGMDGIAVALLGNNSAFGVVIAGLLFGGLKASSNAMSLASVPKEIGDIIMALVVLFTAMNYGVKKLLLRLRKEEK